MRDRRKRLKSGLSGCADGSVATPMDCGNDLGGIVTSGDEPAGYSFPVDSSMFECGSFAARCSVRMIHEVVMKFDSCKKDLVRSTGFEGILHFPPIKQINRKFSLWLMSCVNERMSTINIGKELCIKFNKYDVGHVFGIPYCGKDVLDGFVASREAKDKVIQQYLGEGFRDQRSIKIVKEILERQYTCPMTMADADRFRVAFVVFVVSNLLCPSAKYDYASVDYWYAIQDPEDISSYDWCGFVITRLLEGVTKLKQDIANNIKFPNITGCAVFLLVLYLDSLDLGCLTKPQNTFPRVREFSFDSIREMILADKNYLRHCKPGDQISHGKLRDPSGCVYSWALQVAEVGRKCRSRFLLDIWETAVAMVHLLNIPLEAAGPVFVAAADFQEQINAGMCLTGTHVIKIMSVLVSIMIPYSRGFSYQSSYFSSSRNKGVAGKDMLESAVCNGIRMLTVPIRYRGNHPGVHCTGSSGKEVLASIAKGPAGGLGGKTGEGSAEMIRRARIGDGIQCSVNGAISSMDETPHHMNVNLHAAAIMAQFYSLIRDVKRPNDFDLNHYAEADMCSASSSSAPAPVEPVGLPSPWDLGLLWSEAHVNNFKLFEKLRSMEHDESNAIVHREPRYIQVTFRAMCAQLSGKSEMELDLFDALVRCARQDDDSLYSSYGSLRWRHIFESDFMAAIISGSVDLVGPDLREHLSLSRSSFDLRKCKLVFFPALLQCQWVCFVWQPEKNLISVFDPSYGEEVPDARVQVIERACFLLKLVLKTLSGSVFSGNVHDVAVAEMFLVTIGNKDIDRNNRSGALCSLFYRCYDGSKLNPNFSKIDVADVCVKMLEQVAKLKSNSVALGDLLKS